MDGTLIDSTAGVVGAWNVFKETYPHIDVQNILSSSHGVRTVDNLRKFCEIEDPVKLENEAVRFETAIVDTSKEEGRKGIVLLPGVAKLLAELSPARHLPKPRWAICTSATRAYATSALQIAGIPIPDVFVTAEDVTKGKPFPEPYLLGAEKCGVDPKACIVFEDAPSGIRSGHAAGCMTVGLLTTHSREQLESAEPDYIVQNMNSVAVQLIDQGVQVTICTED
ncbi:hypothetical protein AMATHDRAFT_74925 [Amanita thiersii Skay4041]|uniref:Phosphatase n=1 Tax=Amanita thiersii Skay4041 TaxID=703135 RepID=A0A2A9NSU0_9AGAR|nr:hypothetical protein AMATHDRAFT_74925 [Amanita thiersii Skay4041]